MESVQKYTFLSFFFSFSFFFLSHTCIQITGCFDLSHLVYSPSHMESGKFRLIKIRVFWKKGIVAILFIFWSKAWEREVFHFAWVGLEWLLSLPSPLCARWKCQGLGRIQVVRGQQMTAPGKCFASHSPPRGKLAPSVLSQCWERCSRSWQLGGQPTILDSGQNFHG